MTVYFDGSVTGEKASYSFAIGETVFSGEVPGSSSVVAEYHGLINALRYLIKTGCKKVDLRGDSQVVLNQVMGLSRATGVQKELRATVLELLESLDSYSFEKIPRAENKAHIEL